VDESRFDDLSRRMAQGTSRRAVLKGLIASVAGGSLAFRGAAAGAQSDCADFCRNLPPGQRGECVSDCQHGTGLYFECEGNLEQLCPSPDGTTAICCAEGQPCQDGVCGCLNDQAFCRDRQICINDNCNNRALGRHEFDPDTCDCRCKEGFVENGCGFCMIPCDPADPVCPGQCLLSADGQYICTDDSQVLGACSPPNDSCASTADCCRCGISNVCQPNGFCVHSL